MIDSKSLRIGNILNKGIVHAITYYEGILGCMMLESEVMSTSKFYKLDELEPIVLDESWLLNMGFSKKKTNIYDYNDYRVILNCYSDAHKIMKYDMVEFYHLAVFQYVNELQNIILSLTGKELTFKKVS